MNERAIVKDYNSLFYTLIAVSVIMFNLIAVFGPKFLLRDDLNGYYWVIEGQFPAFIAKRAFIGAHIIWQLWKIMLYSPELVRLMHVVLLMVPISWMLFYLYHKQFGLSRWASLLAATIPHIIPQQETIPAFINGSYVVIGFFFILVSLLAGLTFITSKRYNYTLLLLSIVSFFLGSQTIAENNVFLFFPITYLYLFCSGNMKKKLLVIIPTFAIVLLTVISYYYLFSDASGLPNSFHQHSSSEILRRFEYYFHWAIPFFSGSIVTVLMILLVILGLLFISLYLVRKQASEKFLNVKLIFNLRNYRLHLILGYFILFAISTAVVFILTSRSYQVRYLYLSYFGFWGLIFASLSVILNKILSRSYLSVASAIVIIIFFGIVRHGVQRDNYDKGNEIKNRIANLIAEKVPGSILSPQVLIKGEDPGTLGVWIRSCGYLRHITERHDIDGQIGVQEKSFYDLFDLEARKWDEHSKMNGFDLQRPLFAFKRNESDYLQIQYVLQWVEKKQNLQWNLYHLDTITGNIDLFSSGSDRNALDKTIQSIKDSNIQIELIYGI